MNDVKLSSDYSHRCTVVGNPGVGGGVLGVFWQIFLREVLGVVRKSGGGGLCFIAFLFESFSKIFLGVHEVPLPLPLPCVHLSFQPSFASVILLL